MREFLALFSTRTFLIMSYNLQHTAYGRVLWICVSWFLIAHAVAHQDTVIRFDKGDLLGLPKEFQPAKFDRDKKILTISGKELAFPTVLKELFADFNAENVDADHKGDGSAYELQFAASWYHGPSLLPPYMLIKIIPKRRDFRFEILVDIESISFIRANVVLPMSNKQSAFIPIALQAEKAKKQIPKNWHDILGEWRSEAMVIKITNKEIKSTEDGKSLDYPSGSISPVRPGVMLLKNPGKNDEEFLYELDGDIIEFIFERTGGIGMARLGSPADKTWQRRNLTAP